jgi:uncharacterized protein (TIGR02452 family)
MRREQIAQDTLQILERGSYQTPVGRQIEMSAGLLNCIQNTRCYEPDSLTGIREQVLAQPAKFQNTIFEVTNETTLHGCARLAASTQTVQIGALNFASAKHPGGGFLSGAQAQEESLARSSGLYYSLLKCQSYYEFHRTQRTSLYSDSMIYSPRCPVFRTDDGILLESIYWIDIITSPAPNAGAIAKNEPDNISKIEAVLHERSSKMLSLAAHHKCDVLVLGAWGCGVFQNDSVKVAETFWKQLGPGQSFWKRFQRVLFAVLDRSQSQGTYQAFAERFSL